MGLYGARLHYAWLCRPIEQQTDCPRGALPFCGFRQQAFACLRARRKCSSYALHFPISLKWPANLSGASHCAGNRVARPTTSESSHDYSAGLRLRHNLTPWRWARVPSLTRPSRAVYLLCVSCSKCQVGGRASVFDGEPGHPAREAAPFGGTSRASPIVEAVFASDGRLKARGARSLQFARSGEALFIQLLVTVLANEPRGPVGSPH